MIISTSAAIIKDKKILLTRRNKHTMLFPDHWTLPGGKVNEGEPANLAIVREIKEELNLDFTPGENYHISIIHNTRSFHYLGDWSGEVKLEEKEATAYGWHTYQEALEQQLGFDHKELLEILHERGLI